MIGQHSDSSQISDQEEKDGAMPQRCLRTLTFPDTVYLVDKEDNSFIQNVLFPNV
jgi:hypothetical protein